MAKDKKSRRRGSQAFTFEQSEETMLLNETLQNLYRNKTYVAPQPKEIESIREEEEQEARCRSRREKVSYHEVKKEKRFLETYQFWRVDNKERNMRRKMMVQKLWKGRRRPKAIKLTEEQELMLEQMLDLKEATFEEEETIEIRNRIALAEVVEKKSSCIEDPAVRLKKSKKRQDRKGIAVIESISGEDDGALAYLGGGHLDQSDFVQEVFIEERVLKDGGNQETPVHEVDAIPLLASRTPPALTSVDDSLASIIPADELAEMLCSEELLFCREPRSRKQGSRMSGVDKKGKESRASMRRSARLSSHPDVMGTIFTEEEEEAVKIKSKEQEASDGSKEQEAVGRSNQQEVPTVKTTQEQQAKSSKYVSDVRRVQDLSQVIPSNPVTPVAEKTCPPSLSDCVAPLKVLGRTRSRLKQGQRQTEAVLQDISNKVQGGGGGRMQRTKQEFRRSEEMQQVADGSFSGLPPFEADEIIEKNRRSSSRDGSRRSR